VPPLEVRKTVVQVEETRRELDRAVEPPARKVVAAAVIHNPFAGRVVDDLAPLYELGAEVAALLAAGAVGALAAAPGEVSAYGKGAIVGVDGELEHAAAILHPRFGAPVRAAVGGGEAIIPSTKKVGAAGAPLVLPVTNKDDIWSFDEMDAAEIAIPDAPRPDEILVCLALATGGRPLHRVPRPG
jgi:Amino acid synthesis